MTRILHFFAAGLLMAVLPLEVRAQNTPPVANPDAAMVVAGELLRLDVLANDTDAEGDTLRIVSLDMLPNKGEAAIVDTSLISQRILYRSLADTSGVDSLVYRIDDGHGGQDTALVRITLLSNTPPVARDDTVNVFATEIAEVEVLANDTDAEGDTLRIVRLPVLPQHGTAAIIGDEGRQHIRYDPDDTYAGLDSLRYIIDDTRDNTDTATVRITVILNQRPRAVTDAATIFINTITEIDVLRNDTDAEDDSLFILRIPDPPAEGTAEIIDGGRRIRYTPRTGYLGNDQLDYIITDRVQRDGSLEADRATVFIQVLPPNEAFMADLSGGSVTPPVQTRATGEITATLDGMVLIVRGSYTGLKTPLRTNGARVMMGPTGRDGTPAFTLTPTEAGSNRRNGSFTGAENRFVLTAEQTDALLARRLYVTLQTEDQPMGEIRGPLLPAGASAYFRAVFSGRAAFPSTHSTALGGIVAERFGKTLTLTGAFEGLEADFTPNAGNARLQRGSVGTAGAVLFNLNVDLDANQRGGEFRQQTNAFTLNDALVQLLDNGQTHVVISSEDAKAGEIRGQLLPLSTQVFESTLAGGNEVPRVVTGGNGGVMATLDGQTLALSGDFGGLNAGVDLTLRNGAHIHQATPSETGPIVFEVASTFDTVDRRSGVFLEGANTFSLTTDNQTALLDGLFYVNVHTENDPNGEVRGHLLPSPNVAPAAPVIAIPADGATVDLSAAPSTPVSITWDAAADANGNTVYYRWQLAQDAGFESVVYRSELTAQTGLETTTGTLDQALANAGINPNATVTLYHRSISTDGSLYTEGPATRVTFVRGFATDVKEAAVPERFAVRGNYPNPFNPATTVRVDLPQAARVQVAVYDVLGRRVLTTHARDLEAGFARAVSVNADALASGLYLYYITARAALETFTGTGRMTVVK